jgi:hypothetical protein
MGCLNTADRQVGSGRELLRNSLLSGRHGLFCSEKYLSEQTGKERYDALVCEEECILAKQGTSSLERFELSLEFLDPDNAIDKPDACIFEKIFVFSLWVLSDEANG